MLVGCGSGERAQRAEYAVFGTRVEIVVRDADAAKTAAAFRDTGALLQRLHRELHPWEDGDLMALNAALAAGRSIRTTPAIAELIRVGQRLERASEGAFNPAIGRAVSLWGFHTSDYPITEPPPSDAEIDALVFARPSMRDLELDGLRVASANPAVRLDFSGLAKGYAVREACRTILGHGIESALVNAGGDVLVCGAGSGPWRVAIRDPGGGVLETLTVERPLAVFTSGNDYRYGEFDGARYAHLLDPATARPVDEVMQATVVASDPLLADAAATALVVAGSERWRSVAARLGVARAVVVGADGKLGRIDNRAHGTR